MESRKAAPKQSIELYFMNTSLHRDVVLIYDEMSKCAFHHNVQHAQVDSSASAAAQRLYPVRLPLQL
jgi:hypothetical protein